MLNECSKITYPESKQHGDILINKEIEDTHRVMLKKLRGVPQAKISSPDDVVKLMGDMADFDRERFKIVHLDNKNRIIGIENISEGTINAALIHPREAVKGAVLNSAAGTILVHNHPSGIPEPSSEDDVIIEKLREAFKLMGIDVIDALIIGKEGYYSYKEAGRMPGTGIGGIERVMETDKEKCDIAMKAAMSTIEDYCGRENDLVMERSIKFSPCYLLLSSAASYIQMYYLDPQIKRYGLAMHQLAGLQTEVSKKEGSILSCEGKADYIYRETDVDYNGLNKALNEIISGIDPNAIKTALNNDVQIIRNHFVITEGVLKSIETKPHFYDPDEGKVTISVSIKARPGVENDKSQEIDKGKREERKSFEKMLG